MAIQSTDIVLRLSGGAANANAAVSLGGAESSTVAPANRFGTRTAAEASAGTVLYRCLYVQNNHASLTLTGATALVSSDTPDSSTTVTVGVGTSGVGGTEQTVANETAAPNGVTFSAGSVALGDIPAGGHVAIWEKLVIAAGAAAVNADPYNIRITGNTTA